MNSGRLLATGMYVIHDGERWQVTAMDGSRVTLIGSLGRSKSILVTALADDPGFDIVDTPRVKHDSTLTALQSLDETHRDRIADLAGHIRELQTGYRSGDAQHALSSEPRAAYFPGSSMMGRYAAKAVELGVSVPTVRRMASRFQAGGPAGLLDGRSHRGYRPLGFTDPAWIEALRIEVAENVDESQVPGKHLIRRTRLRVRASGDPDVEIPSRATAYRRLDTLTKGQQVRRGDSAKQKRSIANRPRTPYGKLVATRLGQYILLDSSPCDGQVPGSGVTVGPSFRR